MYGRRPPSTYRVPVMTSRAHDRQVGYNIVQYGNEIHRAYAETRPPRRMEPPPYIYVDDDVFTENYITERGMTFLLIFFILAIICIFLCRFKWGIRIIRSVVSVIGWIFWAAIFYLVSFVGFIVNMAKVVVLWLWGMFTVVSNDASIESNYWGPQTEKKIVIDGVEFVCKG